MGTLHYSSEKDSFSQVGELDSITLSPNSKKAGLGCSSAVFSMLNTHTPKHTHNKMAAVY